MLTRILKEFRESKGAISLNDLSRRLGVEQSVLAGMLETLVRQGKLREVRRARVSGGCHYSSGSCHGCAYYHPDILEGKSYELVFQTPNS